MFTVETEHATNRVAFVLIATFHLVGIGLLAFAASSSTAAAAVGVVAYLLGLRHAFDPDHLLAIDNSIRLAVWRRKPASAAGFFFSLGHCTVVVVASAVAILGLGLLGFDASGGQLTALRGVSTTVAGTISGCFLIVIGLLNLRMFVRASRAGAGSGETARPRGLFASALERFAAGLHLPRRMFLVGLLFGLGLDTALSIVLLIVGASSTAFAGALWLGLSLPILFLAGMSLGDTVNGRVMNRAYRWASENRHRRAAYNVAITGVSVLAALTLGTVLLVGAGLPGIVGGAAVCVVVAGGALVVSAARRLRRRHLAIAVTASLLLLTGCTAEPTSSPTVTSVPSATATSSSLTLTSSAFLDGGTLPVEYTCDGASASPPLAWSGAPTGTVGYAVIMHHVPGDGITHWYWVLYDMASTVDHLAADATPLASIGTNSVNRDLAYAPPCSKGPGPKSYIFTVYALGAQPVIAAGTAVSRDVLLAAIAGHVLAEKSLTATYDRTGVTQ